MRRDEASLEKEISRKIELNAEDVENYPTPKVFAEATARTIMRDIQSYERARLKPLREMWEKNKGLFPEKIYEFGQAIRQVLEEGENK